MSVVKQSRANEVTVEEVMNLKDGATGKIGVGHLQVHLVGFYMSILGISILKRLLLFVQGDAADESQCDSGTDDTEYTERIGTSISRSNLGRTTIGEHRTECLVGGTKSWSVGDGSIHRTYHHWKVDGVARVEEDEIAGKHHCHIEQYSAYREHVERDTSLTETLKETRSHLKSNHEDKQDKTKILNES